MTDAEIDEYLDETFVFFTDSYTDEEDNSERVWLSAERVDHPAGRVSTFSRPMFEVIKDHNHDDNEMDEEGYVNWRGNGSSMRWSPKEMTDEEVDEYVRGI
jgi:hypothetical protein